MVLDKCQVGFIQFKIVYLIEQFIIDQSHRVEFACRRGMLKSNIKLCVVQAYLSEIFDQSIANNKYYSFICEILDLLLNSNYSGIYIFKLRLLLHLEFSVPKNLFNNKDLIQIKKINIGLSPNIQLFGRLIFQIMVYYHIIRLWSMEKWFYFKKGVKFQRGLFISALKL